MLEWNFEKDFARFKKNWFPVKLSYDFCMLRNVIADAVICSTCRFLFSNHFPRKIINMVWLKQNEFFSIKGCRYGMCIFWVCVLQCCRSPSQLVALLNIRKLCLFSIHQNINFYVEFFSIIPIHCSGFTLANLIYSRHDHSQSNIHGSEFQVELFVVSHRASK